MSRHARLVLVAGIAAIVALAGSFAIAQNAQDRKPGASTPPAADVSALDMQACIAAGTPGPQHERLAKSVGVWHGRTVMYGPDTSIEPTRGECTWTVTSILGGRFTRAELDADIPGFGQFNGLGFAGFDNVSQKYIGAWLDSNSSGIMNGSGELSSDGATLTWNYTTNCPITRKPVTIREVQTTSGPNSMTFDMFAPDAHTGKEYKCMHIDFTRQS